jgi:hypothetical protein
VLREEDDASLEAAEIPLLKQQQQAMSDLGASITESSFSANETTTEIIETASHASTSSSVGKATRSPLRKPKWGKSVRKRRDSCADSKCSSNASTTLQHNLSRVPPSPTPPPPSSQANTQQQVITTRGPIDVDEVKPLSPNSLLHHNHLHRKPLMKSSLLRNLSDTTSTTIAETATMSLQTISLGDSRSSGGMSVSDSSKLLLNVRPMLVCEEFELKKEFVPHTGPIDVDEVKPLVDVAEGGPVDLDEAEYYSDTESDDMNFPDELIVDESDVDRKLMGYEEGFEPEVIESNAYLARRKFSEELIPAPVREGSIMNVFCPNCRGSKGGCVGGKFCI